MIITGYQGIGKSTLAKDNDKVIDLESSCFWKYDKRDYEKKGPKTRPDDWYVYYCQMADFLSRQGYIVFVSCHKEVRDFLSTHHTTPFCAIFPAKEIKDQWIRRLEDRYQREPSDKNMRALEHAKICYESDINQLLDECQFDNEYYTEFLTINKIDYNLNDLINKLVKLVEA